MFRSGRSIVLIYSLVAMLFGCSDESRSEKANSEAIRINQIGYYPESTKIFTVIDSVAQDSFQILDSKSKQVLFTAGLSQTTALPLSGEKARYGNFTQFNAEGEYVVHVEGLGFSYPFRIASNVLKKTFYGSIKGLYYQRASMPLEKQYAGKWYREMGHPDDSVSFHSSSGKSEGFLNSPGGWYDAGDYNKYIINACFPLGQFFLLEEQYPQIIGDDSLNIPESGNGVSDYLDELKYELDWALTMQDIDGGVFHKLTTKKFEDMVMPNKATSERFIVGKSTAASLNFVAATAQAYRIFSKIDSLYARRCLEASIRAYDWALKNSDKEFVNPDDISTGQYGDKNFDAEWFWANAELFVSTKDSSYLESMDMDAIDFEFRPGESWTGFMRFLGIFSILEHKESVSEELYKKLEKGILKSADDLVGKTKTLPYFQPIDDFQWGSNSDILNAAMVMAQAYRLSANTKYLGAVQQAADYILGNNATGYSFVTGFGAKTPMFIHHRQSEADGIDEPVPGLLSGGPNSRMQDSVNGTVYPKSVAPMQAWVDQVPSYASNEICLNWNAPLTYILGFLEQESN